ncbi:MAG: hypothetical protein K0Q64_1074 [Nitrobacter vulgaris]|nr:hypothetical protein [Nitrobacter vulgaris]
MACICGCCDCARIVAAGPAAAAAPKPARRCRRVNSAGRNIICQCRSCSWDPVQHGHFFTADGCRHVISPPHRSASMTAGDEPVASMRLVSTRSGFNSLEHEVYRKPLRIFRHHLTFALPTPSRMVANVKSTPPAGVAELVDALDLGSSDESCGGSSPSARTKR